MVKILAIESSCDETAAAIVEDGNQVLANIIASQIPVHQLYGGVVPEIAARQHLQAIVPVVEEALKKAQLAWKDIDAVAVSYAPGLVGALLVGVSYAKALAFALKKPLIAVNHLEGHIMANFLEHDDLDFPFLALVVSGSHSGLIYVEKFAQYKYLGQSRDDAAGEAFDKIARALNLGYPGGPAIEKAAQKGKIKYDFPQPMLKDDNYDFSFSGLKSAVLNFINQKNMKKENFKVEDVAASAQEAIVSVLSAKAIKAANEHDLKQLVLAGGVAANKRLRAILKERAPNLKLIYPSLVYCTDNAAMIGAAAYQKYLKNEWADSNLNAYASLALI